MYTQMFKEILLQIEPDKKSIEDFVEYLRIECIGNPSKLNIISEFERGYLPHLSIWWYTRESFVYEALNRSLRLLKVETIINMGFFSS